jgi:hypothetical protein
MLKIALKIDVKYLKLSRELLWGTKFHKNVIVHRRWYSVWSKCIRCNSRAHSYVYKSTADE